VIAGVLGEYYEHIPFEAYFFDFIGNGKWAFDVVNSQRVQKDWVSPIVVQMLPIKINVGDLGAQRDFTEAEADELITPHLEEIARAIQRYAALRRTLIFLPLIQTCERFVEIAHSIGLAAANVSGPNIDVHGVLNQLRDGELDVVANSMLLSRGVDIPEVDALMVARVTKSVSLYQQFVGRGTRLAPGKTNLLLLDPLVRWRRAHGVPTGDVDCAGC
jgi:superfamily II DNA or RNA helicase